MDIDSEKLASYTAEKDLQEFPNGSDYNQQGQLGVTGTFM